MLYVHYIYLGFQVVLDYKISGFYTICSETVIRKVTGDFEIYLVLIFQYILFYHNAIQTFSDSTFDLYIYY